MRRFIKMHSAGNDFVVFAGPGLLPSQVVLVADRRLGVGCDQVICYNLDDGIYHVNIYNSDGSSSKVCGNGFLCLAYLVFNTSGVMQARFSTGCNKFFSSKVNGDRVSVNMGPPSFYWRDIPLVCDTAELNIEVAGLKLRGFPVSMGNPHLVFFVESPSHLELLPDLVQPVHASGLFPNGVNISMAFLTGDKVQARVWERGAKETQACGSAACAIFATGKRIGLLYGDLSVEFIGGTIHCSDDMGEIMLHSSSCAMVFMGQIAF